MKLPQHKPCNLLALLIRHQKQSYKTSEVNIPYWPIESIESVNVWLEQRNIEYNINNDKMIVKWK